MKVSFELEMSRKVESGSEALEVLKKLFSDAVLTLDAMEKLVDNGIFETVENVKIGGWSSEPPVYLKCKVTEEN